MCTHFAQAFKRGMVCWPKGFQAWQKETFVIPPAERRARLQYHASLYHKPSTIMAIDGASGELSPIAEGLFSRLSYADNETIVSFCGDLIANEDYERERLAGRGFFNLAYTIRYISWIYICKMNMGCQLSVEALRQLLNIIKDTKSRKQRAV